MGDNHFDDLLNGCPGGQFMQAPPFALYTIFPCLRWQICFYLLRIPFYLALLCAGLYMCVLGLISLAFCVACLPLSLLGFLLGYLCCDLECKVEIFCIPGMLIFGFLCGISMLLLEMLWLPVALVLSLVLIPIELCSSSREYDEDEGQMPYWKCCSNCRFSEFWCFPIMSILRRAGVMGNDD